MANQLPPLVSADVPVNERPSNYPEPFASRMAGRFKRALGARFGLTAFGANLTTLMPGAVSALHHRHSRSDEFVYLLDGELRCNYPDGRSVAHIASAPHGRYSLNDAIPRRFTAKVVSGKARVMRLDRRYLEKLITWDQLSRDENYRHFGGSPGGNNWVFRLLRSQAFARLPTGNIEKMFQMFEPVNVKASEVVMREGDAADYFYVVREGTASVSKYLDGAPQVVAYLREGGRLRQNSTAQTSPLSPTTPSPNRQETRSVRMPAISRPRRSTTGPRLGGISRTLMRFSSASRRNSSA